LVTGVTPGTATIRAVSGSVRGSATVTVTAAAPPPPSAPPAGPYVYLTAYHAVPCATYGFGDQNPAPGRTLQCEYGPLKTTTLRNPMPGMAGLGDTVVVPLGAPGAAGPRLQAASYGPSRVDGSGSFRTTCGVASFGFVDPIVYPGRANASHLHVFFGNAGVTGHTTPESVAGSGNSTCRGGTLNRSAYWAPAVVDARTGQVQTPDEAVFYYKTGYNVAPTSIRPFPAGLRMIAGDKNATAAQPFVSWECRDRYVAGSATIPTACPAGDAVRLTIIFPQCWDGRNLDSPDHKSHMAYPVYRNPPQRSTCPSTHPVTLPEITEHFDYPVTAGAAPAFWRLSSDMYGPGLKGGLSAHADWMNGWDAATMNTIVTRCLNPALDCGVGSIGNGKELY
jgi:hypothetical protein